MSEIAIKFENISKQYRLGNIGTGTISHDLNRWWAMNIRGKEDPNLKIGQVNDRAAKATSDYVWALNNIDFEVKKGEVLGIIGKNGAGKSTLLKILSRVTSPTTGRIMAHGRIASLLEVGTGFHPEMTGRENIYMNGAIMGMTKAEITRKLDEIIDFAGVEKYIDTPVKRYSSGMTVRLGFAIAAHLEPEILVVDEVLAVGDAEFQKKAIGKMQDVSHTDGRTVLFVSHNLAAVRQLCTNSLLLGDGKIIKVGDTLDVVNYYQEFSKRFVSSLITGNKQIKLNKFSILDKAMNTIDSFCSHDEVNFHLNYFSFSNIQNVTFAICFNNELNQRVTSLWTTFINKKYNISKGDVTLIINVPAIHLIPGIYEIITFVESNGHVIERIDNYKNIIVGNQEKFGQVQLPRHEQGTYIEEFHIDLKQI